jgi:hypothetical protein
MDTEASDYLHRLQASVAEASRLMEMGSWEEAEKILAQLLRSFTDAGLRIRPEHEWLRLEALWAICRFWRGDFEQAAAVLERASQARKSAGLLDWHYLRQRQYLAFAKRGLCDFGACLEILNEAILVARRADLTELCNDLEQAVQVTEAIRDDAPHTGALALKGVALRGPDGMAFLGDVRAFLRGCESLGYNCHVTDCNCVIEDQYRLRLELGLEIDNNEYISSWPESDLYPGAQTPVLFGLLLPKNARVNHGDFQLEINDPDPQWRDKFFFLQNQFTTIFHPASYPPLGFYPIPRCKAYRYIRGDFSLFRTRIPPRAQVYFKGTINYSPSTRLTTAIGDANLQVSLFLPYATTCFKSIATSAIDGLTRVRSKVASAAFLTDRLKFNPSVTPTTPEELPEIGDMKTFSDEERRADVVLRDLELLTFHVTGTSTGSLDISVQPETHVVPFGFFNEMYRPEHRNPEGGFDASENSKKPVPLVSCILINKGAARKKLSIDIVCRELTIHDSQSTVLDPYEIRVVRVKPQLPSHAGIFETSRNSDVDLRPRSADLEIRVTEERITHLLPGRHVAHRHVKLSILPPDYMVWGIANHHDGKLVNLRKFIAKWVTPGANEVRPFLNTRGTSAHQSGDAALKEIYDSLLTYSFLYDNSRLNFGTSMEHDYQRVRMPGTTLTNRRMNCIDGTVLLASIYEGLGFRPAVVFIPGHAFLAVLFGGDLSRIERIICIESTGLCSHWFRRGSFVNFDPFNSGRCLTYEEASYIGLVQFKENEGKLFGPSSDMMHYQLVPIEAARSEGVNSFQEA